MTRRCSQGGRRIQSLRAFRLASVWGHSNPSRLRPVTLTLGRVTLALGRVGSPRMAPRCPQDGPKSAQRREAASDPKRIRFRSQPDPTRNRQGPDHGPPRRARGENDTKNGSQNGSQNVSKSDPKIGRFLDPYREAFLVLLATGAKAGSKWGRRGQLKAPKPLYL